MPGCAAVGCSNSAKKGFLMKRFPKDPIMRKKWLIKTKRDKWTPNDYFCLCEVHFAPEMWEKTRVDGSRKLKINAVPTIFTFSLTKESRKKPKIRQNLTLLKGETQVEAQNLSNIQPHTSICEAEAEIITEPQPSTSWDETQATVTASDVDEGQKIEEYDTTITESASPVNINISLSEKLLRFCYKKNKKAAKKFASKSIAVHTL